MFLVSTKTARCCSLISILNGCIILTKDIWISISDKLFFHGKYGECGNCGYVPICDIQRGTPTRTLKRLNKISKITERERKSNNLKNKTKTIRIE